MRFVMSMVDVLHPPAETLTQLSAGTGLASRWGSLVLLAGGKKKKKIQDLLKSSRLNRKRPK